MVDLTDREHLDSNSAIMSFLVAAGRTIEGGFVQCTVYGENSSTVDEIEVQHIQHAGYYKLYHNITQSYFDLPLSTKNNLFHWNAARRELLLAIDQRRSIRFQIR